VKYARPEVVTRERAFLRVWNVRAGTAQTFAAASVVRVVRIARDVIGRRRPAANATGSTRLTALRAAAAEVAGQVLEAELRNRPAHDLPGGGIRRGDAHSLAFSEQIAVAVRVTGAPELWRRAVQKRSELLADWLLGFVAG
jgi:hypothetical protein